MTTEAQETEESAIQDDSDTFDAPERLGVARLSKLAFDGKNLEPLWKMLRERFAEHPEELGLLMDMSVIAQLGGQREQGLEIQAEALKVWPMYRTVCADGDAHLRVLVLAAALDMGGNTPIEFLLENETVELLTLYVVPGAPLPDPLPDHDVAFVAVPDSDEAAPALAAIEKMLEDWPVPVVNRPANIRKLYRSELYKIIGDIPGVFMPQTVSLPRADIAALGQGKKKLEDLLPSGAFPLIIRPLDSHAGRGLAKIDTAADIAAYLEKQPEADFFLSSFIDYSSKDTLFRKYRIAFINGKPYACHMAISQQWDIWYLNAHMAASENKLAEEKEFMTAFDKNFGSRHKKAMAQLAKALGLEYFAIDCAETKDGKLFVFEASNTMIVHNMDLAGIYPYKAPQMLKVFDAFTEMLEDKADEMDAQEA